MKTKKTKAQDRKVTATQTHKQPWLHRTKTKAQNRKVTATQTPQKTGGEPRCSQKGK